MSCRALFTIVLGTQNGLGKLTDREALTVLCSFVKHAGNGWSTKEVRNTRHSSNRFLSALKQNRAQSRLLYLFIIKSPLNSQSKFPSITFNFQNKLYFQSEQQCLSMLYTFIKHAKISQSKSLLEWFK